MALRLPKRGENLERGVSPGEGVRLPKGVQLAGPSTGPQTKPNVHTLLDMPVSEAAKIIAPDQAARIPESWAKRPLRVILQTSDIGTRWAIMSGLKPYLAKHGITAEEIDKAAAEPSPAPEPPRPTPTVSPAAAKQYGLPTPATVAPATAAPPPAAAPPPPVAAAAAAPAVATAPAAAAAPVAAAAAPPPATGGANLANAAAPRRGGSGGVDTKGVSPGLVAAIQRVGANYGPYEVRITSGLRPGSGTSQHAHGKALDVGLFDRKTGEKLPNYQNSKNVGEYQALANAVYADAQKNDPALASRLRWGGYFGLGEGGKPKYGTLDLMHFDEAGDKIGMKGGSWAGGFSPEMQKYWKIPAMHGGGAAPAVASAEPISPADVGPAVRTAPAGGVGPRTPEGVQRAFLASISRGESPAYNVMYGGKQFSDLSRHPMSPQTVKGITSDAAGKYQFIGSTWKEQAAKYGYKDFSEKTQDTAAWNYAKDVYKTKTGRDMEKDLTSNDPNIINGVSSALNKTWTSLPGGPEDNWKGKSFADIYTTNLSGADTQMAASGTGGIGSDAARTGSDAPTATASGGIDWGKGFGDFGDALAGMGEAMGKSAAANKMTSTPANLPLPNLPAPGPIVPLIDPKRNEMQRQMLAMAMQRLNSGKLA